MRDIFNQFDHYKKLAETMQNTGALKAAAELQKHSIGSDFIKNTAIEAMQARKSNIDDILGASRLSTVSTLTEQYNKILGASASAILQNEQNKLSKMFSETKLASVTSQYEKLFNNFDIHRLTSNAKHRNLFGNSILAASSANMFNAKLPKFDAIFNSHSIRSTSKIQELLNRTAFDSYKTSNHILSNIATANSFLRNFDLDRHQSIKELQESFSVQLFRELKTENIEFSEAVEVVEEAFSKKIEETPKSLVTFEGMINLFFAFALYLISQASAVESEETIMERINQLEQAFLNQIVLLAPKQQDTTQTYYIVKRTVNLRSESTTKSPVLGVLYPNQKVKLISRKSKWIYVEYFDNLNGIPRMGWVYKKYLKMEK